MFTVAAPIWNRIAPYAENPGWAMLFSMNANGQARAMERLATHYKKRGADPIVVLAYEAVAPFLAECWGIAKFLKANPNYRDSIPEICSVAEAVVYAKADYAMSATLVEQLKKLLVEPLPASVYRPRPVPGNLQDAWYTEARAIAVVAGDHEVAAAAYLDAALDELIEDVEDDPGFSPAFTEWQQTIGANSMLMLAVEQACKGGVLASVVWRCRRLATAPASVKAAFQDFVDNCPPHVAAMLAHQFYWLVRAERSRRTGSASWTAGAGRNMGKSVRSTSTTQSQPKSAVQQVERDQEIDFSTVPLQADFCAAAAVPQSNETTSTELDPHKLHASNAAARQSALHTPLTLEQEQKLLPALTRLFEAAFRMGYLSFKKAAKYVIEAMVEHPTLGKGAVELVTIKHLQGAYISMSSRYPNGPIDDVATVSQFTSKAQIMMTRVPDRPQDLEPLDAGVLLGRVAPENDEGDRVGAAKTASTVTSERGPTAGSAIVGLIEALRVLNRQQRLMLVIVLTIIVCVPAWFFRFQPVPAMGGGTFINRWTGTIYVVGLNGRYTVAEPIRESDR